MNRAEIKEAAKEKIRGNKWNIIWPIIVIGVVTGFITMFFDPIKVEVSSNSIQTWDDIVRTYGNVNITTSSIVSIVVTVLTAVLAAGYMKYILNFVRTGEFNSSDILNTVKEKWLAIIISSILTTVIITLCTLLFVIPGIIMSFAYTMVTFIVIDTDTSGSDSLRKSREMMKGYKMDYFIFQLSFIGWHILAVFTLGILYIWLVPYITVAETIYYDKLKEKSAKILKD